VSGHAGAPSGQPEQPEQSGVAAASPPAPSLAARLGVVIVAIVAVVLVVALIRSVGDGDDDRVSSPLLGEVVPALAGPTLDGRSFDIDDRRGQWVVVNFFASWCVPCRNEHPELAAFAAAHDPVGDAGVVSVLINDRPEDAAAFFARYGGDWPVLLDERSEAVVDFGVTAPPETYLVSPTGVVAAGWIGQVTREGIEAAIDELGGQA
jgi:cytochrome c biogenesis protein CcmG, thiol:disulfide interchange protein DsbE